MDNSQNLTVFQKLTRMFGFPGVPQQDNTPTFNKYLKYKYKYLALKNKLRT